jgi:glutathione-regulated potassium-efflux system ancillary protein KefF
VPSQPIASLDSTTKNFRIPTEFSTRSIKQPPAISIKLAEHQQSPRQCTVDSASYGFSIMTQTPRILIVYAHPAPHRSRINRRLAEAASTVPNVYVHDLYDCYPDFFIDVSREQALLATAELVVFQHPIQWYGMPSLLKEWVDVVLEQGWAYGPNGNALRGKDYWLVATTGGTSESYREGAYHGHAFSAFLPPFRQTAALCGMRWQTPYILHGAHQVDEALVETHVAGYLRRLQTYPDWRGMPPAASALSSPSVDEDY